MPSRRCAIGCESWPDDPIFTTCSVCGEPTTRIDKEPTIGFDEARSIKLHDLFEQFYERRCDTLGIPADGPLPVEE
jgi:hypothetical protein